MFKKISLKGKLVVLCATLSTINLVAGLVCYIGLQSMGHNYHHVVTVSMPNVESLTRMSGAYRGVRQFAGMLGLAGVTETDAARYMDRIGSEIEGYEKADRAYNDLPFVNADEESYYKQNVQPAWLTFKASALKVVALYKSGQEADRALIDPLLLGDMAKAGAQLRESVDKLVKIETDDTDKWVASSQHAEKITNILNIALVILGVVFGQFIGQLFASGLTRSLREVAASLAGEAKEVAGAATSISQTSDNLSSSATQQAAALQETAASIEEMSAMVNKNADNAAQSRQIADGALESANRGKHSMEEMTQAIGEINTANTEITSQVEAGNRQMAEIVQMITEIGNKTKVINDIVFQTKLLSFNASVEAARAGEHGKGFAVVAEEVGNLAAMSGNAAKEISEMLENSIQKVDAIGKETQERVKRLVAIGTEKVSKSTDVAKRCTEALQQILQGSQDVSHRVTEIATASEEQARGVRELTNAMQQLDQITQRNAASSQEAASSSDQLSKQAGALRHSVHDLVAMLDGAKAAERGDAVAHAAEHGSAGSANAPAAAKRASRREGKAPGKVIHLETARKGPAAEPGVGHGGSASEIPSEDDQRFVEV